MSDSLPRLGDAVAGAGFAGDEAVNTALIGVTGHAVSYGELAQRVDSLAAELAGSVSSPVRLAAVCLPKSDRSVVAILASLSSDLAYVPLDVDAPVARLAQIMENCRAPLVVLENRQATELSQALSCETTLSESVEPGVGLLLCHWQGQEKTGYVDDLAMVLYTSGSTGVPKGVQITHGNALAFINWSLDAFPLGSSDVVASIAPFHFDLSIFDLFVTLRRRARLLVLDQKTCQNPRMVAALFAEWGVTSCYATPTFLKQLLRFGRLNRHDHSALRRVMFAGEVFEPHSLDELRKIWSQATFHNLYGPTETNVVTSFELPAYNEASRNEPYPIGMPCPYASCLLRCNEGQLELGNGRAGELLVAGATVTPGYLESSVSLSDGAFVDVEGKRYYCTGDLVRYEEGQGLVFEGRTDRMIKRHGYRIAPEELERVLSLFPEVESVATTCAKGADNSQVTAHIVPSRQSVYPEITRLKAHCLEHLPAYFLPDKFAFRDAMPVTSSGKVDYRELEYPQK